LYRVYLPLLLAVLAVGFYFWFLWFYALNAPYQDDIFDILRPMIRAIEADSLGEAWQAIYPRHNDHRTLGSRLVYLGLYQLQGEINFRSLVFVANFAVLVLAALLLRSTPVTGERWLLFLPAALLLFQLKAYGIVLWPMAAFAYFFVTAWGFVALYCLVDTTPARFILAIASAFFCTFSLASGQLIWLVGGLALWHQAWILRRLSRRYLYAWLPVGIAVLVAYQVGPRQFNSPELLIGSLLETPLKYLLYYFALLGSALSFDRVWLAVTAGVLMLAVLLVATLRHWRDGYSAIEYGCWFLMLSVAAMVIGRAPYTELDYSLQSRYSYPSTAALASLWIVVARRWQLQRSGTLVTVCALALVYNIYSWSVHYPRLSPYTERRYDAFNRSVYWAYGYPIEESRGVVNHAIDSGIYQPPGRPVAIPPRLSLLAGPGESD
jgi:hypothetical protein